MKTAILAPCAGLILSPGSKHIATTFPDKPDDAKWHVGGQETQIYFGVHHGDTANIAEHALTELRAIRSIYR